MDYPKRQALTNVNMDAYEANRTVLGVSPTSSFNYREQAMKKVESDVDEVFTSGKYLTEEEEKPQIFKHVTQHLPEWAQYLKGPDDIDIKRLNGNSNACFKVNIKDGLVPQILQHRSVLYRRYEQKIIDKKIE